MGFSALRSTRLGAFSFALGCVVIFWNSLTFADDRRWLNPNNWHYFPDWTFLDLDDRIFSISFEAGAATTYHSYSNLNPSPPNVFTAVGSATLWWRHSLGVFGMFGYAPLGTNKGTQFMAGGLKLSLLTAPVITRNPFIKGIKIQAVGDFCQFSYVRGPNDPDFDTQIRVFRGGLTVSWGLSRHIYFDTSAMGTRIQDNFYVYPYVGFGVDF